MILCRTATELLTDDMEGRLTGVRKAQYRFHMLLCNRCRAHRRQMQTTIETLQKMPRESVSEESKSHALEAFRKRAR